MRNVRCLEKHGSGVLHRVRLGRLQRWIMIVCLMLAVPAHADDSAADVWAYAFQSDGLQTDGLLIVDASTDNPQVLLEAYAEPYDAQRRHLLWSVSKSLAVTVVGAAAHSGLLRLDDPLVPPLRAAGIAKDAIHVDPLLRFDDVLRMSSGIAWQETYEEAPFFSDVLAMLYTRGRGDMGAFVAAHPQAHAPGTHWQYSSGDTNLAMRALQGVLGSAYANFPWDALLTPLGMHSVVWEQDAAGAFVGSSYLYATPRDLAKLGVLYLRDGVWEGRRLLPADFVQWATQLAPAYDAIAAQNPYGHYGAGWWLNAGDIERGIPDRWPHAPRGTYAAMGHWGQYLFVIPEEDLVVVRTGNDRERMLDPDVFLPKVIAYAERCRVRAQQNPADTCAGDSPALLPVADAGEQQP